MNSVLVLVTEVSTFLKTYGSPSLELVHFITEVGTKKHFDATFVFGSRSIKKQRKNEKKPRGKKL